VSPFLKQILQLKFKIGDETRKNNKLKKKIIALQEDMERTVSIVTAVFKSCQENCPFPFNVAA